ncbi:hypothetical protein [Microbacterium sp. LMI1-1-1.1]
MSAESGSLAVSTDLGPEALMTTVDDTHTGATPGRGEERRA